MGDESEIDGDAALPTVSYDGRRIDRAQLLATVESRLFVRELEPVRFGRYILEDPIGEGGFGIVYRGQDPILRRPVAIKLLRSRRRSDELGGPEALVREAQMAAQLQHPNVVRVFDVGCVDNERFGADVFVVMELLSGLPLGRWVRSVEPEPELVVELMAQVADGLAAAHRRRIVHCDVKPGNVMITGGGQAKVVDFGLALHSEQRRSAPTLLSGDDTAQESAIVAGTPAYMAPEVHEGASLVPSSDQYSFAIMLAEALAGEYPFERGDSEVLYRAKLGGLDPAWLRKHIPRGIIPIIERAASRAPGARYSDLDQLREDLSRWLHPSRALPWAAGAVALVAGAGVAWGAAVREPPSCVLPVDAATEAWAAAQPRLQDVWAQPERTWVSRLQPRFEAGVDTFVEQWSDTAEQVCAVHPADRVASQCLLERLGRLDATFETLDGGVGLEHADKLLAHLGTADACLKTEAEVDRLPVPRGASESDDVAAVRDELFSAHTLFLAGRYDEGLKIGDRALQAAMRVGFEPVEAEALLEVGLQTAGQGRFEDSIELIEQAYFSAQGSRYEWLTAATSVRMVAMYGVRLLEDELARKWARRAESALLRLPASHRLHAEFALNVGLLESYAGNLVEARRHQTRALELYTELGFHDEAVRCELTLGELDVAEHRYEQALERFERGIQSRTKTLGLAHPATAYAMSRAGLVLIDMGEFARARETLATATTILERSLGPEHPHAASVAGNLGVLELTLGFTDSALPRLERTLESFRARLPADHLNIADALDNIATVHTGHGELARARSLDEQALEIRERGLPPGHPMVARSHAKVAEGLARAGRVEDARRELALAVEAVERWPGALQGNERTAILEAQVALGERPVREYRELLATNDPSSMDRWDASFMLAKLLETEEPAEGHRLAGLARDGFSAMGATPKVAEVDAWLLANGG